MQSGERHRYAEWETRRAGEEVWKWKEWRATNTEKVNDALGMLATVRQDAPRAGGARQTHQSKEAFLLLLYHEPLLKVQGRVKPEWIGRAWCHDVSTYA